MGACALRITTLRVIGFRNLRVVSLEPDAGANVFVGNNGQGKTSLLEAIDYVATLRSFRGASRDQLISHEGDYAEIALRTHDEPAGHDFRVRLERTSRQATVDAKRPERAIGYYGRASCVVFHPEDLDLVRGVPAVRRRLLDRILVRLVDGYGEALRSYARALKARNALLRERAPDDRALMGFESLLAQHGTVIARERTALVAVLAEHIGRAAEQVALPAVPLSVLYRTRTPTDAAMYLDQMVRLRKHDVSRKVTTMGPHVDDVQILWGGRAARVVASQGQARAVALAIRLAELKVLTTNSGRVPWLLLDDVSSELDRTRTERLFTTVRDLGAQLWVTTTDPGIVALLPQARIWTVRDGFVEVPNRSA